MLLLLLLYTSKILIDGLFTKKESIYVNYIVFVDEDY